MKRRKTKTVKNRRKAVLSKLEGKIIKLIRRQDTIERKIKPLRAEYKSNTNKIHKYEKWEAKLGGEDTDSYEPDKYL